MHIWIFMMFFAIIISAILSSVFLKSKQLSLQKQQGTMGNEQLKVLIDKMEDLNKENHKLKQRVENLETLVNSSEWLGQHHPHLLEQSRTDSERIAQMIEKLKKQ